MSYRKCFKALLLCAVSMSAQTAYRVDPNPIYTTQTNIPPGAYAPMLAIGGATISINTTSYTNSSGTVACPSNAQVVIAGASGCVATASPQGAFGFWLLPGNYLYTVTLPTGQVLGPYPVTVSGAGGGGGGSPGGPTTSLQYNNGGTFLGSANLTWNGTQLVAIGANAGSAAITVTTGFINSSTGFLTPGTAFNAIQAPAGGLYGLSATVSNYMQPGSFTGASPTVTTSDSFHPGALSYSVTNTCLAVYNGSSWPCVSSGGGGSPGGATTNVQYNSAGVFGGSANFTWDNAARLLTVLSASSTSVGLATTGFMQATGGFLALSACTNYNCIQSQSAAGGMAARNFTSTKYIQAGNGVAAPSMSTGDTLNVGTLWYDTISDCLKVYKNALAYSCLDTAGATTPGGATTNVQFNNAGAFGGSANMTWNNAGQLLTVTATSSTSAGIATTGFFQSVGGMVVTSACTNYNCIQSQALSGGAAMKSFTASAYVQAGSFAGAAPTVTTGDTFNLGALSYSTTNSCMAYYNGATWPCITAGGGGAVSAIIGTANQVLANGTSGSSQTGAVTLTLPQSIATTSAVGFASVTATGVHQSTVAAGAGLGFQIANGLGTPFSVNGSGDISGNGSINMVGASAAGAPYKVNGTAIVDSSRNATFNTETSAGAIQSQATGAFTTFGNTNFNFLVNGNGAVTAAGVIQSTGAAGGVNATTNTAFNTIQVPNGGMYASSFTALRYIQPGSNSGVPAVSTSDTFNSGAMYYDTSTNFFRMYLSGIGWNNMFNSSGAFVGSAGVDVGAGGISAGNYNVAGGYIGQTWNIGFASPFTINGSGPYTTLVYRGGVLVSAF